MSGILAVFPGRPAAYPSPSRAIVRLTRAVFGDPLTADRPQIRVTGSRPFTEQDNDRDKSDEGHAESDPHDARQMHSVIMSESERRCKPP